MHPPKDDGHHTLAFVGRARPEPEPALKDTAGWQALYKAMLAHITGNVEAWLQTYLAEAMAAGQAPGAAHRPAAAGEAAARAMAAALSSPSDGEMRFAVPPWLEPFKDPANVRFTRTPDHILVQEKELWAHLSATNDDVVASLVRAPEANGPSAEAPVERRPYVLPPNVRNTRTPDRLFAKPEPEPVQAGEGPADLPPIALFVASPPEPVPSLAGLIADAYRMAGAAERAERVEQDPLPTAAAPAFATALAPHVGRLGEDRPWTRMIVAEDLVTPLSLDQDNAREALARFLLDNPVSSEPEGEAADPVEDFGDEPLELLEDDAEPADTHDEDGHDEDGAEEVEVEEKRDEEEEHLPEARTADGAETVPAAAVEVVRAPAALPNNALHMSLLSGLSATRPARRVRGVYEHPDLDLLAEPVKSTGSAMSRDALEQHARLLEGVLEDFGIRGEIINVRPGPVVTLYELEPAPGIKSSRVVGLADDIARSMSAISARVAVVQGRNVIGIELPNVHRDTVYLRELLAQTDFDQSKHKLAIALGKTIGGEPVIVDLARMPHLLVAGTTGSGKSVAINTMILSLLYRLKPEECRLIMVDPKMLELSIYDGIPHLLTPVVTDPKKAVVALKWAVREMEDRYKKMSKVGVRNIDGFNARVTEARAKGETIVRSVHTGFDRHTGEAIYQSEEMDLTVLPYIVVIVDEMADLMMVAGKDIEGAIQRLAQMARAAGIHLIMATQRPSVDVITGTIKANFPTRISFQVTSKIDSRTILGEQGAEQLLGQGDMLHMMGGGRIARVHGPFVSDHEVELVVNHLKAQGQPDYLDVTTEDGESDTGPGEEGAGEDGAVFDKSAMGSIDDGDLYDQAVKIVLRDKKCSTSYIQRRLSVGYNKAASLVEKMEKEGIVGPANHAGKREILIYSRDMRSINISMPEEDDDA